ncbi:polyprenyl glycosylphosphotransferase [Arthrobacter psychrolactophilus]|uniref:Polyprenyl glycosylphosphotransferase n=1 Tax=Arthrobacter psychrolactophilus TaxID=92442 RepID=A0A2V5JE42_9MICC|nr:sugar transferase [Arthrobacter psychrolactophilus]PYI37597.1 polyprenyl glycosylphosphotransferase [Arthrobacter psychrolactophilus]
MESEELSETLTDGNKSFDSKAECRNWRQAYVRRLRWVDGTIIVWALLAAQLVRFGFEKSDLQIGRLTISYWLCGVILGLIWYIMLGAWDSRKIRIVGSGTDEFKLVLTATTWLFGTIAIFSYAFGLETARGYVLLALPIGSLGILLARWIQRQMLHKKRQYGHSSARVLVVAGPQAATHLARSLTRQPSAGFLPIAAHIPGLSAAHSLSELTLGTKLAGTGESVEAILESIATHDADTVALSAGVTMSPKEIRDLGWALADLRIRLIMAPALTDIAGPRVHVQPVAGLPLVHVSTPQFSSGAQFAKRVFDIVSASLLLIVLSPVLLVLAIIVSSDRGPVLFKQPRVGLKGSIFKMLKFRSMVVDAEAQVAVLSEQSDGNGVMFKMKNDPRVTNAGKWMRRFSLDELPQLWNVLVGNMSLVGPRPPLESEAESYEKHVHRRFMVKPGITGLWQVSGRSDLSWEDTVRLDLYYVENWSFAGDILILLKTLKAVIKVDGAY